LKKKLIVNGIEIRYIGGNPFQIPHDSKDTLVWMKCLKDASHPSYLITPYDFVHGQRCPLCEGREPINIDK